MKTNFRVLGAGVWGLALSDYLLELGHNVEIFCRDTNLEKKSIKQLTLSNISSNAIKSLDKIQDHKSTDEINIIAVNSRGFDDILVNNKDYFASLNALVSLTKGIDHKTGLLFSDLISDMFNGTISYGLLSGPSFARDLTERKPIRISFASKAKDLSDLIIESASSPKFEVLPTTYVYFIEIAGVIKNIAAILCGMADKYFGNGVHTKTIIKKACEETWLMGLEASRNPKSQDQNITLNMNDLRGDIMQLPGYLGDMILTCKQNQSRNYQFGELIADKNINIQDAKDNIGTVEGYDCCKTLVEKSSLKSGELTNRLYSILCAENSKRENLVRSLLQP